MHRRIAFVRELSASRVNHGRARDYFYDSSDSSSYPIVKLRHYEPTRSTGDIVEAIGARRFYRLRDALAVARVFFARSKCTSCASGANDNLRRYQFMRMQ